ncbi:lipopolysaccharide biosynthesis protein [Halorussus amylolyticus]|uniref:lipopolysaccharide biosynthesis protein n=1 Tax=Halorussus amylolyticus TaxID=1126242 RepID=UPI0010532AF1|nr:lipopolysaccharide biosynthesis protein [Halorussus amylolyticus]
MSRGDDEDVSKVDVSDEVASNVDVSDEVASDEDVPDDEREALLTIAHGAVVTSGGVSAQRALVAGTEFVLARGLGPVAYGVYALAWRIAQLLARLVTFGSVPTLQRYLPAYRDDPARRSLVAGLAYATTIGFGLVIATGVWVLAPWINAVTVEDSSFPAAMRLFGVLVVLLGLVMIYAAIFRAVGSARGEVVFNKLLRPGVRLVGALAALALGYSVVGVAGAFVVCVAVLVVVGFPVTTKVTGIRPTLRGGRTESRRFYDHAAPVAMSSLGKVFQNRVDILLVGALLTAVAAGIYNVVLVLIAIAWIPLMSFNQLLPPVASNLYSSGRVETLNAVYSSVTRLIVTTVLPILAVQLVFGRELLALFGPTYVRGYVPLAVYLGGVFVGSAVGATGWLLMMTDHQYARMALDWLLAVLNVVLTYVFVVEFGLVGAALGTSLAIAVQNALQVVLLRQFEGLWPFDATYLKPLGAGVVMAAVMAGVRASVGGQTALVVGTLVGLLAYVGSLYALGIDARDRLVVRELAGRYRANVADAVPF